MTKENSSDKMITAAVDYYDSIAEIYDSITNNESVNDIRCFIRDYFVNIPCVNKILDFGAGTGNDLEWQLESDYSIVYFEPSVKMAAIANDKFNIENNVQIEPLIGEKATYSGLEKYKNQKFDAIFSNFAAFNSIEDINKLFEVLFGILKKSGSLVCVVYYKRNKINRIKSYLLPHSGTEVMNVSLDSSGRSMLTYLHTRKQLLVSAKKNRMKILREIDLDSSGFRLFHFIKN